MRVAAIYDVHGNLPALEAVLDEVVDASVELVVVGGDVLPGPIPRETLDRLLTLDVPVRFIEGNGDRIVRAQMIGQEPSEVPERFRDAIRWNARQLLPEHAHALASWPPTLELQIPGLGGVLFCHATPRSDSEIFTSLTPEAELLPIFAGLGTSIVVCGHTHVQFDRKVGTTRVVNAGSVGMPFEGRGAHWLLLGQGIHLRCTPYDAIKAAERLRRTTYPEVEDFVTRYVLPIPP